jgi:hypothetical protein
MVPYYILVHLTLYHVAGILSKFKNNRETVTHMSLKVQRKGKKILLLEAEFKSYMTKKLDELTGLAANTVTALIVVSLIVVLTSFKANDYLYWALLLIPLIGRYYIGKMVNHWLKKQFKEIIGLN